MLFSHFKPPDCLVVQKPDNELLLVQQMQAGSEEAFTTLYKYYSPRLYMNILQMVRDPEMAEELVQELFTRIWLKRTCIGLAENFTGYMYRIAQNLAHDYFRKIKNDRRLLEKFRLLAEENYKHIEETVGYHESAAILKNAIDHLSPQQRKVYHFVREEGYTYEQAAEIMGISPQTVKEYLVATTKAIRKNMLNHLDGDTILLLILMSAITGK